MDQFPRRLLQLWSALPGARRALLAGLIGAFVACAVLIYSWSTQVNYVPLYSGLDPSDSGAIVDQLRASATPFELGSGGTSILVPQDQVDQLRLNFAAQGLPQGGNVGFELLNGSSFTATDFVQRLNFQRGLQGELQRTIESINSVERARVHIVIPEKSLFVRDQTPPTASVVLRMRPGQQLDSREVRGIVHLVSGAVEGLQQTHVSVLDTNGTVLHDGSEVAATGVGGASGTQLEMQQQYERSVESGVQQLLDRTLGAGRATVKVAASLNFDRLETTTETFSPGAGANATPIARSASTVTETYQTGQRAGNGAVPGAVANVPGANAALPGTDAATATGTGSNYQRQESTQNFEVGKTQTKNIQAPGTVRRVSVSLLLDEQVPEAQVAALQAAVSAAAGLDTGRGDSIAVGRFPFDRTSINEATAAMESEATQDMILGYARLALPVVALLIGFVLFRMLMRSLSSRGAGGGYSFVELQNAPLALGSAGAAALATGTPQQQRALPAPVEEVRSEMEEMVTSLVKSQPQMVADMMQAWVKEDI